MNKRDYASLGLIALMLCTGAYISPNLPERMAVHWNISGEADGYASKAFGVLAIPALTLAIYILMLAIPMIDVFKKNIMSFKGYFDNMKLLLVAFMTVIYLASLMQNLEFNFNIGLVVMPSLAVLIYYIGHALPHTRRNFFIGVRTPWTLASETVWNKTHLIAGRSFRLNAILIAACIILPSYGFWIVIASLVANALFLAAYSYVIYQKEGRNDLT
jgi:uncharacterized membrane protein